MRIPKAFISASTAVVLLSGRRPTQASATSWDLGAADDTMSERRGTTSGATNAGFAIVDSMWPGASSTSPITASQPHDYVLLPDVPVRSPDTREKFQGFSEPQHRWFTPLKQVAAGPLDDAHNEKYDSNRGSSSRWRSFSWEPRRKLPDQFMVRFWNAFLYVCHVINADNIRILLHGSHHHRRRRYRRFNPNSRRNRRYRRIIRARADISRIFPGSWARDWARGLWSSPTDTGEKERNASGATETTPCPVGLHPVELCPEGLCPVELCSVGLSAWLQMAAPTAVLPPASPPALLTPLDMLAALFPSSENHFLQETDDIPVVDPYLPDLSMASLHRTSTETMVIPALDAAAWLSLLQSFVMVDLCHQSGSIAPAGSWNGVVRTGVDRLSVACPTERMGVWFRLAEVVGLYSSARHGKVLCVETRPYTRGAIFFPSFNQPNHNGHIMRRRSRFTGYQQPAASALALPPASNQRPRLCPPPPAAALGATIPREALVALLCPPGLFGLVALQHRRSSMVALCPPGLPGLVSSQRRASDFNAAVMTATLDAATWSFHSRGLTVMESSSCQSGSSVMPEDGWSGTIGTGFCRWFAACRLERVDVRWTLVRTVELPLNMGYDQVLRIQARAHVAGDILTRFQERNRQALASLSFYRLKNAYVDNPSVVSSFPSPSPSTLPLALAAAPWPPRSPVPPTTSLGAAIIPLELPVAPWPPALSRASLPEASVAALTSALDAGTWPSLAKIFAAVDLCECDSVMPEGGWDGAIQADVDRLSVACPAERADVSWILAKAVELYPNTGYAQGSDYAAFAIYRGMGGNKEAAVRVFAQWASPTTWFQSSTIDGQHAQLQMGMRLSWKMIEKCSPAVHAWLHSKANASLMLSELTGNDARMALYASIFMTGVCSLCTRLGLPGHVVHTTILKTLEAGNSGPAVSLWVMHCLLGIAEAECHRTEDFNEDVCIQSRLYTASKTVTGFEDLHNHAPMPLTSFIRTYRAAMSSLPLPAAPCPPLCPFPPTATLGEAAATIPLSPPVAPWPPALPAVPPHGASEETTTSSLDAATWLDLAHSFAGIDCDPSDSVMPEGGWEGAIKTDVDRLYVACPSEQVDVRWILEMAVEFYPNTGYAQGADYAALAIYRGMGRKKQASLRVFVQWASPTTWFQSSTIDGQPVQLQKGMRHSWEVLRTRSPSVHAWLHSEANASLMLSELTGDDALVALYASVFMTAVCSLCTRQGLPGHVVCDIIQHTLEAGSSGPAVSLWVVHCLLRIVEADCKRNKDVNTDTCIQARLLTAGKNVTSFDELERHAPTTLGCFVQGYEAVVVPV